MKRNQPSSRSVSGAFSIDAHAPHRLRPDPGPCDQPRIPQSWTYCRHYVVAVSRGGIPRLCYPVQPRNIVLPKHQTQLCGMFLYMSHAVQLQLQETKLHPFKHTALIRLRIG